ncbi:unnamed protein product [Soboliphyme baturini]|uniref:AMP-binding_C domain-containing protein n=1 Tax=Soboliphyme baturini TaxID=241478 RepID=A0A183IP88_9BILA|nr:unnamed protein product [Soboliphyme baturini]
MTQFQIVSKQIVDCSSGTERGPNSLGEIWMRTSTAMKEYLNRPTETSETMNKDGWIKSGEKRTKERYNGCFKLMLFAYSGDIGFMDEENNLFVIDRIKELIKYKGNQIAPAELEFVLQTHPAVFDVAVVGVPHPVAGEVPRAFVVRKSGSTVSEDELCQFLKGSTPQRHVYGYANVKLSTIMTFSQVNVSMPFALSPCHQNGVHQAPSRSLSTFVNGHHSTYNADRFLVNLLQFLRRYESSDEFTALN